MTHLPRLARLAPLACLALCLPTMAFAVEVEENFLIYEVSAGSIAELKQEMKENSPNQYWGYTEWFVRWDGQCNVSVEITYTLPEHIDPDAMTQSVAAKWDAMLGALTDHELQHGQHGINAAYEVEAANCQNGGQITDAWSQEDQDFDRVTQHGILDGVHF
jgi:predicted secreted Zn-dependent protease